MRSFVSLIAAGIFAAQSFGCAQISVEDAAIAKFTAALETKDMGDLRQVTSGTFQEKALRQTESLDDLKILRLPEDPPTVVKVEDVSDTEKNVTVTTEGSGRRLLYRLVRNSPTDGWVVDDIYMKRKQKGLRVTRSVTEQMDLLLSVREFLRIWESADRDSVIGVTTPKFAGVLQDLQVASLVHLTSQVADGKSDRTAFRPEAQLDGDRAIVKLPRTNGELLISYHLLGDEWKVDDVSVRSSQKDSTNGSLRRQGQILSAASKFLQAYGQNDKTLLADLCTPQFHKGALLPADFSKLTLPSADQLGAEHEIKSHDKRSSIIVPGQHETIKIDLVREENIDEPSLPGAFLIDDVTLFHNDGSQQRRLSSVFTSQSRLMIFNDALARGDISLIRRMSSNDFNERVWRQMDAELIEHLPFETARMGIQNITDAEYLGPMTKLRSTAYDQTITWVLKESNGRISIDDMLIESKSMPDSMKERLELLIPSVKFAQSLRKSDINQLSRVCSQDFNRIVWKHTKSVPDLGVPVDKLMASPLMAIRRSTSQALVQLGDEKWGAKVNLLNEHGHWVIDEVKLVTGVEVAERADLKHAFRHQLAVNSRRSSRSKNAVAIAQLPDAPQKAPRAEPEPSGPIKQRAANVVAEDSYNRDLGVVPATYEFESDVIEPSPVDRVIDPASAPIEIPFE